MTERVKKRATECGVGSRFLAGGQDSEAQAYKNNPFFAKGPLAASIG
jgi:hypothetical protein